MKSTTLALLGVLALSSCAATAQELPPPVTPTLPPITPATPPAEPVTQPALPPVTQPPQTTSPPTAPTSAPSAAATPAPAPESRIKLTGTELQRRLEAIFVMEGIFQKHVALAANATQREIETFLPGLRLSMMFSRANPKAQGTYLEDYGVFFQIQIPSTSGSVVQAVEDIARSRLARPPQQTDPAQPATMLSTRSADAMPAPDALYVDAVRRYLTDAMLENSKSLDLRPNEWLTVSARGDDGAPVELAQPSIMILRVKGSDLTDFIAGRLTRDEVRNRVVVQGFSGR